MQDATEVRSTTPLLVIFLLSGLLLAGADEGRCDTTLFWDDFADGNADDWVVVDFGGFEVIDEKLCVATVCEP
jgi:hypothetical protein